MKRAATEASLAAFQVLRTTGRITIPGIAWREAALDADDHAHRRLFDEAACLHEIEVGGTAAILEAPRSLRVIAWNAERLKHVEASADLLVRAEPDVILLSEVDHGMARSGNRHT